MLEKLLLIVLSIILASCGSMSVGPVNPYDDDPLPNQPMTIKAIVDPTLLQCSILAPCNVKIFLVPASGLPNIILDEITIQNIPQSITINVQPDDYMIDVKGLSEQFHPVFPDGYMIANEPGVTGIAINFESGTEYVQ